MFISDLCNKAVTYCDIHANHQHPSSQTLAQLTREQAVQQLSLRGLSERDVARFMEMLVGIKPSEGVAAAIHQETGGNPLFVTEVVRLLSSEHHLADLQEDSVPRFVIPQGIRHAIDRRLDGLSTTCRDILACRSRNRPRASSGSSQPDDRYSR